MVSNLADAVFPVAIVGAGCRLPGADGLDAFRALLGHGDGAPTTGWRDGPGAMAPDGTGAPPPVRRVEDATSFDAEFFGLDARETHRMHPTQRVLLEVVHEAMEHAGMPPDTVAGTRTAVVVSAMLTSDHWERFGEVGVRDLPAYLNGASLGGTAATLSRSFDLRGPTMAVDATCAGGLLALHVACQSLQLGEADLAVAAGGNLMMRADMSDALARVLSDDGECRFGDADGAGFGRAEGVVALLLEPLDRALAQGHPVRGVIRGSGTSANGRRGRVMPSPDASGQEEALRRAHEVAGIRGGDLDYVEAHGTGTAAGDRVELASIARVVSDGVRRPRPCLVGSVKSHIGHAEPAAGLAGTLAALVGLEDERLHATRHVAREHPVFAENRHVIAPVTRPVPWPRNPHRPRLVGVSSIGASGMNVHLVLEEAPEACAPPARPARARCPVVVLPLSARSPRALTELARSYLPLVAASADVDRLRDLCYSAALHRTHHEHRAALVADGVDELVDGLEALVAGQAVLGVARGRVDDGPSRLVGMFGDLATCAQGETLPAAAAFEEHRATCLAAVERVGRPSCPRETRRVQVWARQVAAARTLGDWGLDLDVVRADGAGRFAAHVLTHGLGLEAAARSARDGIDAGPDDRPAAWPRGIDDGRPELVLTLGEGGWSPRAALHAQAARAWTQGHAVRWDRLLEGGRLVDVPRYPWQRRDYGLGPAADHERSPRLPAPTPAHTPAHTPAPTPAPTPAHTQALAGA